MRHALAILLLTTAAAAAQTPPATPTGARPGNDIGTGQSLPRSDKAGNISGADTKSELAPNLPAPQGVESVHDLLLDARKDLSKNQTGAAQEALERAETRALDRSVPAGTEQVPDQGPLIAIITQAREQLGNNNIPGTLALIDKALRN